MPSSTTGSDPATPALATRPLDIALGIFRLQPLGGLERHAIRLAERLVARGHRVTLYSGAGVSVCPAGAEGVTVEVTGLSNHVRLARFAEGFAVQSHRRRHDLRVGFQKMPGLDVLFCADPCYAARRLRAFLRHMLRARAMRRLEAACFGPASSTRILALADAQLAAYRGAYGTATERTAVLPPTADRHHRRVGRLPDEARRDVRKTLALPPDGELWLWIGVQPLIKGLDRAVAALSATNAVFAVCGAAPDTRGVVPILQAAERHGVRDRIVLLGRVDDGTLAQLYDAADLLIHPARMDVTGTVIVEALAHGLPVVTSGACGYAAHVTAADAGLVTPEPFEERALAAALAAATPERRRQWSENALAYSARHDLFGGIDRAAELIEAAADTDPLAWVTAARL